MQQMLATPRGQMLADFGAFCEEKGYDGADEGMMRTAHEEWLQTPRDSLEGKRPSEMLEGGRLLPDKVETYRREEPKVGRNDPCPCGSGKKYKKCHGKGA
jgi:preprotein translocase subunit SecA